MGIFLNSRSKYFTFCSELYYLAPIYLQEVTKIKMLQILISVMNYNTHERLINFYFELIWIA